MTSCPHHPSTLSLRALGEMTDLRLDKRDRPVEWGETAFKADDRSASEHMSVAQLLYYFPETPRGKSREYIPLVFSANRAMPSQM